MELRRWWEQPLRIVQLNLTVPDAGGDGALMARRAREYGANALLINAGGIYAFYPTDVPFHRRAPGLTSDLLGDAIRECHAHGLRVIVRYDLIGLHRDAYEAHPEWFYRSHDGRPMVDKGLYMTCPNAGWWQERFFTLWDELTARYAVDGLFFNAWGHKESTREGEYFGPCHCPRCVRLFRERYGRDLPVRGDRADPAYWLNRQFRRETLDDLGRRIYRYAKEKNPQVAVFAGAGHRALATGQADCTEIELHCGSTASSTGPRWRHAAGESCKLVASLGPGFASGINAVYCHVGPGRWRLSAAPTGWLGYTLAQTIANAGWPYCMMIGTLDTQPDRTALPALRDLLTFAAAHEADYRGLASAAGIGLLWSERTATEAPGWTDTTDRYVKHFRGWYDLLTRRHRLFDVLSDAQLEGAGRLGEGAGPPGQGGDGSGQAQSTGGERRDAPSSSGAHPGQVSPETLLERYTTLVVPNPARLSAAACATLDRYVELGGRLIVTGGPPLGQDGLRSLGAEHVLSSRARVSNSYFRIREADRRGEYGLSDGDLAEIDLLPVEGTFWHVARRPAAETQLGLIPPEDYGAPEQTYFTLETDHPGALRHRYGEGSTTYLPWEPDRAWFETGVPALGALLDALVAKATPRAAAWVGEGVLPETVELTAHRQPITGRLLIHLVNGSGGTPPRWADPIPLHHLAVRFAWGGPPPHVRAARAGMDLPATPVDGGYEVTVPLLGLFELLTVQAGT